MTLESAAVAVRDGRLRPQAVNDLINVLITAGWYQAALASRFVEERGENDVASRVLIDINLAEAEYNLGEWDAAWERLRGLDPVAAPFGISRAGLLQQRAWILARRGDGREALRVWSQGAVDDLPRAYHAEYHFTHAAALLATRDFDGAFAAVARGAAVARRISSGRNALFLEARVAAAAGELDLAEELCRRGAEHPFRTQGGDGLLLWGDLLARLGGGEEARAAWQLARERDPESESAAVAATRLWPSAPAAPSARASSLPPRTAK